MNKRIGLVTAGLVAGLVMVGGTAFAVSSSIPDSAGVIHGCYDSGGNMKVIDTSVTASCPKGYSSLNWNQQGPAGSPGLAGSPGQQGVQGPRGPQGPQGPAGTGFTWTTTCLEACITGPTTISATTVIAAGSVLTPVSITETTSGSDDCPFGFGTAIVSDSNSTQLAKITFGFNSSQVVDGPDTIAAGNGGPLSITTTAPGCTPGDVFTVTFSFDETQPYS